MAIRLIHSVVYLFRPAVVSKATPQQQQVDYSEAPHRPPSYDLMMLTGEEQAQQMSSYSEFL